MDRLAPDALTGLTRPGSSRKRHGLRAALAVALAQGVWLICAPGCGGSGATLGCPAVAGCGGNPSGTWQLQSPSSYCAYVPPLTYSVLTNTPPLDLMPPESMVQQTPGKPPAAPKYSGDWCYALVYEPTPPAGAAGAGLTMGGISNINLPKTPGGLGVAAVDAANGAVPASFVLDTTHEYNIGVKTLGQDQVHFAPDCLTAYGANPTCADLATGIVAYYVAMPNFRNVVCLAASDGGCDCSYAYAGAAADTGSWRSVGNILYFFSDQNPTQPVVETDYCVTDNGKTLTLGGRNGQSMFADNGLRSVTLSYIGPPAM